MRARVVVVVCIGFDDDDDEDDMSAHHHAVCSRNKSSNDHELLPMLHGCALDGQCTHMQHSLTRICTRMHGHELYAVCDMPALNDLCC